MRAVCSGCGFITERCLCDYLRPISNKTHLIILQHPDEKKHALNTVKLMRHSFLNLHFFSGEQFGDEPQLLEMIKNERTALLFPDPKAELLSAFISAPFPYTHLILLDGTWKKAKKIYFSNPFLHTLPKIALAPEQRSQYRIRQSSMEHSLSTLEAAVSALKTIEPETDCSSVMKAFQKMIDFQIEKMGMDVFEKNYKKKGSE